MPYPTWTAGQRITGAQLAAMAPDIIVKSSDTSRASTTTLAADPHLLFSVVPGTYVLDGGMYYAGEYNNGNLKLDWAVPPGTAMRWSVSAPAIGGQAAFASQSSVPGIPLTVGTYGVGGAGDLTSCQPMGHIVVTNAGTLQLRWAQAGSHTTATTIAAPSWLRLQRIA
ncbi:hypothetical protein ACFWP2_35095 [Kitasatospora sp. NPDC058444]|uniref:hypothetical protein n=1 Tax=Kitasatospora sp. NPDC058444 TaxID=3346504 RepID=UPI00365AB8BB